ncbi:MAG: TrkH family potassium uptake protein [Lachnospiraceae bacterium]
MNRKIIIFILGWVLKIEGFLLLMPCAVAILYQEKEGWAFALVSAICLLLGFMIAYKKPKHTIFYLKEGCVATSLTWILMSIFGALPFVLNGDIPKFTDALFETISGFTTTGASILSDVESLSYCSLFWRSFTHWIGGMGVLVFLLTIIPLSGGSHMNLMRAESPGPSVGKLVPKVKSTARILYAIYFGMTLLQFILLKLGGMTVFDAITTSFGTAGTGGFGVKNDSIGSYSPYIQWVITIFMILFGVNFNVYYLIIYKKWKSALSLEEPKYYFLIIAAAITIIMLNIYDTTVGFWNTLREVSFQVASIITTTGFSTIDFDLWPQTSRTMLVILMFIGACAGSTGGGIKVSRFVIVVKTIFKELNSYIYPKSIMRVKINNKPIEHEILRSTNVYFMTFILVFVVSVLAISIEGKDLTTNFTAVAATINNIGPGLELVGPTQNFGSFSVFSKYILMFDMLAGRLELFPLLIFLYPTIWKDLFAPRKKKRSDEELYS